MGLLPPRAIALALLAGCLWGLVALAIGGPLLGPGIWAGLIASPLIGLAAAAVFRGFRQRPIAQRVGLALVSLYLAAGLFALVAGAADAAHSLPGRNGLAVVTQTVLGIWWGVTFTGWLPPLWLLAYVTHAMVSRVDPLPSSAGR